MIKIIKGQVVFTKELGKFEVYPNSYIILKAGRVKQVTAVLPKAYRQMPIEDMGEALIIPGFIDVHVHAPQWPNAGVGYSEELIEWLQKYTFPLESKYEDLNFAKEKYLKFIQDLWQVGTTRACIMATKHKEATACLLDLFKEAGLGAYIGKVNMDRHASEALIEETNTSIEETAELIKAYKEENGLVQYIMSPRFVPCTTKELMVGLAELAEKNHLKVQSHLDENHSEVEWVKNLHPECESYTEVYQRYGLLRKGQTIMAHCIYNTEAELELLKQEEVMVAHCAQSNFNLASGIMPLRKYLNQGIKVGLGSDVGAGHTLNMKEHIKTTLEASKMNWVLHKEEKALSTAEAFYLATKGGGSFFGKVGSFEPGYEFDALVIEVPKAEGRTLIDQLERFIYTGSSEQIKKRYVRGKEVEQPFSHH